MSGLHSIVGLVVIAVNALAFGAGAFFVGRRREPGRLFVHLVVLGQTLLVAQGAIGLLLLSDGLRSPDRLHYVYGGLALVAVLSPWIYAPPEPRARLVWFSGASLLAAALAVRAYTTGE